MIFDGDLLELQSINGNPVFQNIMEFNRRLNGVNGGGACATWPPGGTAKAHVR